MKRSNFGFTKRAAKAVCTVSASALMLGVSEAATVGLHFQLNYCYAQSYSGFLVTLPAFGIATNGWENLQQMNTGYGCGGGPPPYTLSTMISTTTTTGGLNPLPQGSLTVTWSAYTANFSGFAGYGGGLPGYSSYAGPPGYDYEGNPPPTRTPAQPFPTGEWEIYSTFLRDGVNFGPGSNGGDNNQQNYYVDITGLQTLFPTNPFVVELIAASDSMQTLTNAFVIDATALTTNSVTYPGTPFPSVNYQGTLGWFRGHGGGLSTVSPPLNTAHLVITGNRAAHGVNPLPNGFDDASTISGFILTDKPVVTMSPRSLLACRGDTVDLSAYAIGVPPLSYHWRKNGVPIPGATSLSNPPFTVATAADGGNFDLVVTNQYGAATSAVSVVTVDELTIQAAHNFVIDSNSNPAGIENDGYNLGGTWQASSTDSASRTRTGVMSLAAASSAQIEVPGITNYETSTGTIMFWMRSSGVANSGNGPAALFNELVNNNGLLIEQNTDGSVGVTNVGLDNVISTTSSSSDNNWHHIAVVYDQTVSGYADIYVDGVLQQSAGNLSNWSWQTNQPIQLGASAYTSQTFNGVLDDVRVYSRVLTATEVASVYNSNALVDTNTLVLRLNFDGPPAGGFILNWQCPDGVLQSSGTLNGTYTDLPGAASPYHPPILTEQKDQFYRYRHTPATLISNPYLM
jgi:Concanavalin A-like lectin/glucanases superfamily